MAQWYIKEFSKLSNVSMRSLRHYDDIGLLKPSVRLPNGYRLYSETDLVRLQQIFALKFFGFTLSQVQRLLNKDLDTLEHFRSQKQSIQHQIAQLQNADRTLEDIIMTLESDRSIHWDKIIQLIEDYRMTKDTKMVWGPDLDKQDEYQKQLVDMGLATQAQIDEVNIKTKSWTAEKVNAIKTEQEAVLKALALALGQNKQPSDPEVQIQIRKHFETMLHFWTPTKEGYLKLAQFYCDSPDFVKLVSGFHPKLSQFFAKAMKVFAENELSN